MSRPRKKTVGSVLQEHRELNEKSAIYRMLSAYIRTRYLPRDSMAAHAKVPCQGAPVSEAMLEEVAIELEEGAKSMLDTARTLEAEEIA